MLSLSTLNHVLQLYIAKYHVRRGLVIQLQFIATLGQPTSDDPLTQTSLDLNAASAAAAAAAAAQILAPKPARAVILAPRFRALPDSG